MTSTTSCFEWNRLAHIEDGLHILVRYKGELCRVEKTALPSSGNERQRDRLIQQVGKCSPYNPPPSYTFHYICIIYYGIKRVGTLFVQLHIHRYIVAFVLSCLVHGSG